MQRYYITKRSDSPNYYFRLAGQRTYHTTHTSDRKEAEEYAKARAFGTRPKFKPTSTLEDYTADFFAWDSSPWIRRQLKKGHRFSKGQATDRTGHLRNYILPRFGQTPLNELKTVEIEDWLINLELAAQSCNHILFTFRIVLREAVREELLDRNPAAFVEPLKVVPTRRDAFTEDEIASLFHHETAELIRIWKNPLMAAFFDLLLTTGMRQGEARALQWQDFDSENRWIRINKAMKRDNSVGTTKNGKGRYAFLTSQTQLLLEYAFGFSDHTEPGDFVFTYNGRNPVWQIVIHNAFHHALDTVGIDRDSRNLVVHSLRHTHITLERQAGVDDTVLQRIVGHQSKKVTDGYDQRSPEELMRSFEPMREALLQTWERSDHATADRLVLVPEGGIQ